MGGDGVGEGEVAGDAADHHLAHGVVLVRVGVDVLHAAQARVGFVGVVEGAHRLDDVVAQLLDLELLREEVEVQQGADVFFFLGVPQGARVEPADEELEGVVVVVREAEGFGGRRGFGFCVEFGGEEGGVVTEEFFVEGPMGGVRADVDVYEGGGEEFIEGFLAGGFWRWRGRFRHLGGDSREMLR